jgi:hypothetical protein
MLAAGGVCAVLVLTGCVNQTPASSGSGPSGTSSGTSSPSGPPSSPSSSATPTVTPGTPGTPVTIACANILTAQQVYDYNPNYVGTNTYKPGPGTLGAQAAADNGRVCGWLNETSGVELEVAIAQPAESTLATLKSGAASGTAVQLGGGVTGYFGAVGGVGQLQAFTRGFWVIVSSADIASESDADPIAKDVLGHLPAG